MKTNCRESLNDKFTMETHCRESLYHKSANQQVGSFKIFEMIGNLAYNTNGIPHSRTRSGFVRTTYGINLRPISKQELKEECYRKSVGDGEQEGKRLIDQAVQYRESP